MAGFTTADAIAVIAALAAAVTAAANIVRTPSGRVADHAIAIKNLTDALNGVIEQNRVQAKEMLQMARTAELADQKAETAMVQANADRTAWKQAIADLRAYVGRVMLSGASLRVAPNRRGELAQATFVVMVIDDDALVVEMLQSNLEAHGYAVVTAGSAREALAMAERWNPPVTIMDLWLGLSSMSIATQTESRPESLALVEQLRALPGLEAIQILVFTGDKSEQAHLLIAAMMPLAVIYKTDDFVDQLLREIETARGKYEALTHAAKNEIAHG